MHHMNIHVKHDYSCGDFVPDKTPAHNATMGLRDIRERRNLTQVQLAEMAGVSQSTLSRLEKLDDSATLQNMRAVASALGVEVIDLFRDDLTALDDQLLQAFRAIPRNQRHKIVSLIELIEQPDRPDQSAT